MKNIRRAIALSVLIYAVISFVGCGRHPESCRQMDMAEKLMESRPDSALELIDRIDGKSLKTPDEKARYALLKSMALDKNYIDTVDFKVLQPAIDYYLKEGSADDRLRTLYYQGRIYQNQGNLASAMRSWVKGRKHFKNSTDTLTMSRLLVAMGSVCFSTYRFNSFIDNNIMAARLYNSIGEYDREMQCIANAIDGTVIVGNKQLADSIVRIADSRLTERPQYEPLLTPYLLSYAVNFGDRKDVQEAIATYKDMDDLSDNARLDMVAGYCKIGDGDSAYEIFRSVGDDMKDSDKYMALKPDVYEAIGNLQGAVDAYRAYVIKSESEYMDIISRGVMSEEEAYDIEQSGLSDLRRKDRIILICLTSFCVLLTGAVLIYYKYRLGKAKSLLDREDMARLQQEHNKMKVENEKLELINENAGLERSNLRYEKDRLELEKHDAELKCERYVLESENMQTKIALLESENRSLREMTERSDNLSGPVGDVIRERIELLNSVLADYIVNGPALSEGPDKELAAFVNDRNSFMDTTRIVLNVLHPGFIGYLENHGLTNPEINYMCLYAIGLRGKEVGNYIEVKRHYHISSDIRKKLGLDENNANLGTFIRKLLKDS